MNKSNKKNIPLYVLVFFAASCSTPLQEVIYFEWDRDRDIYESGPVPDAYIIRANDQLFIQIISDNPLDVTFLNLTTGPSLYLRVHRFSQIQHLRLGLDSVKI